MLIYNMQNAAVKARAASLYHLRKTRSFLDRLELMQNSYYERLCVALKKSFSYHAINRSAVFSSLRQNNCMHDLKLRLLVVMEVSPENFCLNTQAPGENGKNISNKKSQFPASFLTRFKSPTGIDSF